ncbi:MAG: glycoside hydrolase family 130 protein [Phycisphaerales bacterium]|nr:glycoside hydrolase family 130 protein [Phycisphaerales bacterium]MCB9863798.1 glycoside hydrolase family 130 protein [Phycisphaerales bacterium]
MNRSSANPILTRRDIPDVPPRIVDVSSVFNPGAAFWRGRYFLLLRVQTRGRETVLMVAESGDGERFSVRPSIVNIDGLESVGARIFHVYDPRLTAIDDCVYVVFAADTDGGCRLGIARTVDFESFELVSFGANDDVRNGVLFPERLNGRFVRLERPNRVALDSGVTTGSEIVLAASDDLVDWEPVGSVMTGRWHYWDELIGSGPPPVKTREGWLHVYHGVATHLNAGIYQAGVVLLDLHDPTKVIARGRNNILEPRELYEHVGQVPNVVFPSGMIVEGFDAEGFARADSVVRLYYGAADTVVGLATSTIAELIDACRE